MTTPNHATIRDRLSRFDESEFTQWLRGGLIDYYSHSSTSERNSPSAISISTASTKPFSFAYSMLGKTESLLDDIELLYEQYIIDDRKPLFRRCLGRLLKESLADGRFPDEGLSDIIYLMARVRAYESLEALPVVLGRGKLGHEKSWLQYEALSTLKSLLPSDIAVAMLRQTVTLPTFNVGFSLDVLLSLARAYPSDWLSSFRLLQPQVLSLRNSARETGPASLQQFEADVAQFANRFVIAVPTAAIAEQISDIVVIGDHTRLYETGTWLIKSLFIGDSAPLEIDHDKGTLPRDSETVQLAIFAKNPPRTAKMVWRSGDYRAFRRLSSYYEMARLFAGEMNSQRATMGGSGEATQLLRDSNAPLLENIFCGF